MDFRLLIILLSLACNSLLLVSKSSPFNGFKAIETLTNPPYGY
jgi:hypothetical protein